MNLRRLIFRAWYYFRMGYGTYLTFLLGFATTVVTVYYLMINNIPELKSLFMSFWVFAIFAATIGIPLSVLAGYVHFKRSQAYSSEVDISMEANPYYFRVTPGKEREIQIPAAIASIDLSIAIAKKLGALNPNLESELLQIRQKYVRLAEHGDYRISGPR